MARNEAVRSSWRASLIRDEPQDFYRSWLNTRGSLTRRLQAASRSFRVERLTQGLAPPLRDEPATLRDLAWVRDVMLYCDGAAVVFAHSVLARRPRHPLDRLFRGLGNRALGSLLFADPRFHRRSMDFLQIDARHPLYRRLSAAYAKALPTRLVARRARFEWAGKSLLVTEVFLPSVLSLQAEAGR
jgi:chorismate--pyruvate lyase